MGNRALWRNIFFCYFRIPYHSASHTRTQTDGQCIIDGILQTACIADSSGLLRVSPHHVRTRCIRLHHAVCSDLDHSPNVHLVLRYSFDRPTLRAYVVAVSRRTLLFSLAAAVPVDTI